MGLLLQSSLWDKYQYEYREFQQSVEILLPERQENQTTGQNSVCNFEFAKGQTF